MHEGDFDKVLEISSQQLGPDYLKKADLLKYLSTPETHLQVVLNENQILGYSIIYLVKIKKLTEFGLGSCLQYLNEFGLDNIVQLRKSTAIDAEYVKKGIGKKFINYTMNLFANQSELILSINWKKGDEIPMKNISSSLNMKVLCEIENFWKKESLENEFRCPECGNPPCTCKAVIYFKKSD